MVMIPEDLNLIDAKDEFVPKTIGKEELFDWSDSARTPSKIL